MTRVDARTAAVARARLALAEGLPRARTALAAVQGSSDPALLFDWARALGAEHQDGEAHAMLLKIDPTGLARDHTQRWWNEVAIQARDALAAGDPGLALQLADHGEVPVGDQYVGPAIPFRLYCPALFASAVTGTDLFSALGRQCHAPFEQGAGRILAGPRL